MAAAPGELQAILRRLGVPVTTQNLARLSAWQRSEGGSASDNPFNTTQTAPGAGNYNSVGVKNYTSEQQGINATVQTLENGRYGAILKVLKTGQGDFGQAVGSSPWGSSGGLIDQILGSPSPPTSGGGTAAPRGVSVVKAGPREQTHFDQATFQKQAAVLMMQDATARAQGANPTNLFAGLAAARKAATMRVSAASPRGTSIPVANGPAGPGTGLGGKAVAIASRQVGIPYVWGGESRSGFDCSGLIQFVYSKLGVKLPRVAADQGKAGRPVNYANLKAGDLLVENNGDHVVMYAGNGRVIQAPHTGTNVQYSPLSWFPSSQYYARRVVG